MITVLDNGLGNVGSIVNMLKLSGFNVQLCSQAAELMQADRNRARPNARDQTFMR